MSPQLADLFSVAAAVLPVLACLVEWAGSVGISERHHSHHDTYVISSALSRFENDKARRALEDLCAAVGNFSVMELEAP